ncbi:BTB/POZ and TAZ domain-containing protein 3 [Orchesella cincta]|uniref:BTB/POZ and TAZ domain-containing protein 3 n=1 Tax=Orchesella cincta TaxID=48709 RepID=A0A1D2M274_ORCCI|nr:BTB/POZ and TAZ domain-containing protein 3 [Orchesella cincta]
MNSVPNQIYLGKDVSKEFELDLEKIQSQTGIQTFPLFVGAAEPLKRPENGAKPPDDHDDHYRRALQELLDELPDEEIKNVIDLVIKSDRDEQCYGLSIKFGFTSAFAKKISSILVEPKLIIRGKFESETEFLLPYACRASPLYNAKPFFGTFSATGNISKEPQIINNFEGATRIEHCVRTHVASSMSITFTFSIILTWSGFGGILQREYVSVFEKLLNDKMFMDCAIIPSNKSKIMCHRSIVAAQSEVLRILLQKGSPEPLSEIEMFDISEQAVKTLVEFLYKNKLDEDHIEEQTALELLQVANRYHITNLEGNLVDTLYFKPRGWFSLGNVLYLYHFTEQIGEYEMLCDKMLSILKKNAKALHSSEAFRDFSRKFPKESANLVGILMSDLKLP